jgi:polysaccharide export outer membrane protein
MRSYIPLTLVIGLSVVLTAPASSQAAQTNTAPSTAEPKAPVSTGTGYVIGAQDVLSVVFWRDKDMSADVVVRPDGNISLPLLNEIPAAGLTPEQLRARLTEAAAKFVEDPTATVVVKEIHSRNVYITGNVAKPATYSLMGDMTVLQLIAMAGGLQEYAGAKSIVIIRAEGGRQQYHNFNYKDVVKQKHVEQNIVLKPGDTVVVP